MRLPTKAYITTLVGLTILAITLANNPYYPPQLENQPVPAVPPATQDPAIAPNHYDPAHTQPPVPVPTPVPAQNVEQNSGIYVPTPQGPQTVYYVPGQPVPVPADHPVHQQHQNHQQHHYQHQPQRRPQQPHGEQPEYERPPVPQRHYPVNTASQYLPPHNNYNNNYNGHYQPNAPNYGGHGGGHAYGHGDKHLEMENVRVGHNGPLHRADIPALIHGSPGASAGYIPIREIEYGYQGHNEGGNLGFFIGLTICLFALYMGLGIYFNRMKGKHGMKAIPNYHMWVSIPHVCEFWCKMLSCWMREMLLLKKWVNPTHVYARLSYQPLPDVKENYNTTV